MHVSLICHFNCSLPRWMGTRSCCPVCDDVCVYYGCRALLLCVLYDIGCLKQHADWCSSTTGISYNSSTAVGTCCILHAYYEYSSTQSSGVMRQHLDTIAVRRIKHHGANRHTCICLTTDSRAIQNTAVAAAKTLQHKGDTRAIQKPHASERRSPLLRPAAA